MKKVNPLAQDLDHVLNHTRPLWEELRGQRIFITGGTGFFGCWLLESLAWANDKLGLNASAVVLTRNLDAFRKKAPHLASHPAIRFHVGDVRSFVFPPGSFSYVIHAVTEADPRVKAANPLEVFNLNVEGMRRVLELARQAGQVKVLFTSSGSVYGRQPPDWLRMPETFWGGPDLTDTMSSQSVDSEAKRAAEMLCVLYARQYGLETKIARGFTFVGPYLPLDTNFAIGNFIRDGLVGGPIRVNGDGTPFRSYLYAADLAIWLWTILFQGSPARPYNVGSDRELTIRELAEAVAKAFRPAPEVQVARPPTPGAPPERYVPSTARAREELGLRQLIDLPEALDRTILWHKQHC
jgi:dTDP-glucose 4,6-dehydratase